MVSPGDSKQPLNPGGGPGQGAKEMQAQMWRVLIRPEGNSEGQQWGEIMKVWRHQHHMLYSVLIKSRNLTRVFKRLKDSQFSLTNNSYLHLLFKKFLWFREPFNDERGGWGCHSPRWEAVLGPQSKGMFPLVLLLVSSFLGILQSRCGSETELWQLRRPGKAQPISPHCSRDTIQESLRLLPN